MSRSTGTDVDKRIKKTREVYLRKHRRVLLDWGGEKATEAKKVVLATGLKNLEVLGFVCSQRLIERLLTHSEDGIVDFFNEVTPILKKMLGAHRRYKPMYPNFPKQVMEASEAELYLNAMTHYFVSWVSDLVGDPGIVYLPHYDKEEREKLQQDVAVKVIDLGTEDDFLSIFTKLAAANSSLSADDKELLLWFIESDVDSQLQMPESIPQKETLALIVSAYLKKGDADRLLPLMKTATDVLRVASAMSGGDVSLAENTRFRRYPRKERRFLLAALDACKNLNEDMIRHAEKWKRLGRELRPGDYSDRYKKAYKGFSIVRNDEKVNTYNSRLEASFVNNEIDLKLLRDRPGVFARRLDHTLRAGCLSASRVSKGFLSVADEVSTPVLLQVYNHFKTRLDVEGQSRTFFPKGEVSRLQTIEDKRPSFKMMKKTVDGLRDGIRQTLVDRFAKLPKLGKVYIDERLKQQFVPFAMRSASKSLRTISRGSRLALPQNDCIRFFLWWKNGDDRTDIDLACEFYDKDWKLKARVSYYDLRNFGCAHSGDITTAPNGACEFIDCDVAKLLEKDVQYVVTTIYSFTSQPFCDLPECFAGWMGRSKPQSGEVFEARTVEDKVDLASNTQSVIPVVLDLVNRQAIWADLGVGGNRRINDGRSCNIGRTGKAIAELNKPTLYDLFSMHAEARGKLVDDPVEADTIFSIHQGITPFDYTTIASDYMA
jgi:hypothetical protein